MDEKIIEEEAMKRSNLVLGFVILALCGFLAPTAGAQEYPIKPVTIIIGYGAGNFSDIVTRIVAQKLSERLGKQFLVDNRPGAGGFTAAVAVKNAAPDGYTLLMAATGTLAISPSLFKQLPFDSVKDFEMICLTGRIGFAIYTDATSKIRTLQDFIAEAKAKPGKINFGTTPIGSAQHLGAELFKTSAGINLVTVPYKTSPDVVVAVRANDVQGAFDSLTPLVPHIKSGAIRALAYTASQQFPGLPNLPTVSLSGVSGYEFSTWSGLAAPAKTPRTIINRLNREVNAILAIPDVQQKLLELGALIPSGTPEQFAAELAKDIVKYRDIINQAKIEKQ